jgi:hypothetical protein
MQQQERSVFMTTEEIIIQMFCSVDDEIGSMPKHPQARLYPSEVVTIGILFALKGGHFRAFYRWLSRDYAALFAGLEDAHPFATTLANPSGLGAQIVGNTELLHGHRQVPSRTALSHSRRTQRSSSRQEGQRQRPLECRDQAVLAPQ